MQLVVLSACGTPPKIRAGPADANLNVTPTEKELRFGGVLVCKVILSLSYNSVLGGTRKI